MFIEVKNAETRHGEIALARSSDGVAWRYDSVVLREPFHLSYPHVFKTGGRYYMTPETLDPARYASMWRTAFRRSGAM